MAFPASVDDLHTAIPAEVTPGSEGHYDHHRDLATAVEAVETFVLPAVRIVDLGVVEVADLLAGPVTLYTPGAGELVLAGSVLDVFTLTDSGYINVAAASSNLGSVSTVGAASTAGEQATASPVIATLYVPGDHPIVGGWATATAYAQDDAIVAGGFTWYTPTGGTSGPGGGAVTAISIVDGGTGYVDGEVEVEQGALPTSLFVNVTTTGGVITGIASIAGPSSGYAVGNSSVVIGGDSNAVLHIDTVTGPGAPDWAEALATGNGQLSDGALRWTVVDPVPTTGSAHFYALVATPVAP